MTQDSREVEELWSQELRQLIGEVSITLGTEKAKILVAEIRNRDHHQLQKAREEERERIEAIFKEHVPPHAMDLEDSVWLKRLLNKAFNHDKNI